MLRTGGRRLLAPGLRPVLGGGAAAPVAVGGARAYHERVVDHYENPRNVGSFENDDPSVGTGLVGAPACGDVMKLQIRVDESSGKIVDACFKTFGCGSAIASSSVVSRNGHLGADLLELLLGILGLVLADTLLDLLGEALDEVLGLLEGQVATEWVKGKQMEEVVTIKNTEIAKHLSLPPVKLHCSMLAEDAIKAAVKDYEAKKAKLAQKGEEKAAEA
uniref:NIF system FeS cluster assembly NifU N-terminal domain-containing protein n=1 Tax=Oryza glumipatula TaxID=40148 RepID=A0A0D9YCS0_9ORYZ